MFGLSGEHIVIVLIILLIFGPRKLPELGNTLGKAIKNFKDSIQNVQEAKYRNLDDTEPPPTVAKTHPETDVKSDAEIETEKTKKS